MSDLIPGAPEQGSVRVASFLEGGPFSGDRGSLIEPAPTILYVYPCDCSPAAIERPCGQPTHWADLAKLDELGDAPRHGAYYVKVHEQPARSGMRAALYWHAGFERPTGAEIARTLADFRRRAGRQTPNERGGNGRRQ